MNFVPYGLTFSHLSLRWHDPAFFPAPEDGTFVIFSRLARCAFVMHFSRLARLRLWGAIFGYLFCNNQQSPKNKNMNLLLWSLSIRRTRLQPAIRWSSFFPATEAGAFGHFSRLWRWHVRHFFPASQDGVCRSFCYHRAFYWATCAGKKNSNLLSWSFDPQERVFNERQVSESLPWSFNVNIVMFKFNILLNGTKISV